MSNVKTTAVKRLGLPEMVALWINPKLENGESNPDYGSTDYGKTLYRRYGRDKVEAEIEKQRALLEKDTDEVQQAIDKKRKKQPKSKDVSSNLDEGTLIANQYLAAYDEYKEAEKKVEALKEQLKSMMVSQSLPLLVAEDGRSIEYKEMNSAITSSLWTSYEYESVKDYIPELLMDSCTEVRVNAELLESLVKVGKIPSAVLNYKITKPTMRLTVKKAAKLKK